MEGWLEIKLQKSEVLSSGELGHWPRMQRALTLQDPTGLNYGPSTMSTEHKSVLDCHFPWQFPANKVISTLKRLSISFCNALGGLIELEVILLPLTLTEFLLQLLYLHLPGL